MKTTILLALFILVVSLSITGQCDVVLRGSLADAEGVQWAAGQLTEAQRHTKTRIPEIVVEISKDDLKVDDGYVIKPLSRNKILLQANSEGGVMYGLLDIKNRIKMGQINLARTAKPSLRLRGICENLPFWAGSTMYSEYWRIFEKEETNPNFWWNNKNAWISKFREAAERRVNSFVLTHPHPYPALLKYDKYPEAQVYTSEQAAQHEEMFRWIVREGRKYGVSIYLLTWNIVVPPSFAKAHKTKEFGSQDQVVKEYTRYCVKKLFDTYPELGGLVTMGAETPVGCTDWVIENIISSMNECNPKPNLVWWGWCTYPEDSLKVKQAYKGRTEVMHYLQYEQYFKPMADPRIGRWSRETGGTKMIGLGGIKSAHGYYTWGDPSDAYETVRSLTEDNNGSGLVLETYTSANWLARESFCRYMWDIGDGKGIYKEWQAGIGDRYSTDVSRDLLECYKSASQIIPRFLCLIHSQSDHFQPQLGIPLISYLGMPSLSSYVFEWYDGVTKDGRLIPNYGLTWPNPDWGEKVLTIPQYAYWTARGKTTFTSTTPPQIADEIETSAWRCLNLLENLEKKKPANNQSEYEQTLRLLRMNAYWGLHSTYKIRAAAAWAQFKESGKESSDCIRNLQKSIDWYKKLVDQASQVYPNRMTFYLSFLSSPPPWKQNDIWFSYQPINQHWRDMLPRYEKELELVKEQIALGPQKAECPTIDKIWQEPESNKVAHFGFEEQETGIELDSTAVYSADPQYVISGRSSIVCDTRNAAGQWHNCLKTIPEKLKLIPGRRYQVRLKYNVIRNPNKFSQPFALAARTDTGGVAKDIGTFRTWSAPTGSFGEHVIQIEPKDYDDYYVFMIVRGPAVLLIDDLAVAEIKDGQQ